MNERRGAPTIAAVLSSAARALAEISESPRLDVEVLLAHVLGIERTRLILDHDAELEGEVLERFDRLVRRRRTGEPVAYLTGRRGFRSLELEVDRTVLIPRPETEHLVEAAIEVLPSGARVLDVGTGSGAIALALKTERPDLEIEGVDVSAEALAVAERNRSSLNLDVSLRQADLLADSPPADAVLANLPYVEEDAELPVDVEAFEPALALRGGGDGLAVIRRLAAQLAARPWPGWVGLEIGETQGAAVSDLLRAAGFGSIEVRADLSGRDRIVLGRRDERAPERLPRDADAAEVRG